MLIFLNTSSLKGPSITVSWRGGGHKESDTTEQAALSQAAGMGKE